MHIYAPPTPPDETFSQGYWSAVIAALLYFILSAVLMVNMLGYMLGHYPQHFALTDDQRTLILQTTSFMVWLAVGAAMFQKVFGISFADALYFSDVTVLTLGFGDIKAQSNVGKGLIFPYAVFGIIILALVVASISRFTREVTDDNVIKAHLRRKRAKTIQRSMDALDVETTADFEGLRGSASGVRNGDRRFQRKRPIRSFVSSFLTKNQSKATIMRAEKDRFEAMRAIQCETIRFRRWTSLVFSLIAFAIVWCAGAAVFSKLEDLTYFNALYFAFCSLLTIGYGDITPASNPGRPFFVVWSLIAVPTMTILISKMSGTILEAVNDATNWLAEFTVLPKSGRYRQFVLRHPVLHNLLQRRTEAKRLQRGFRVGVDDVEEENASDNISSDDYDRARPPPRTLERLTSDRPPSHQQLARDLVFAIRRVSQDVGEDGIKRYDYEEWVEFTQLIRFTDPNRIDHSPTLELEENEYGLIQWDWIGEDSPMLAEQTEPEWVLNRLTESLLRYMAITEHFAKNKHPHDDGRAEVNPDDDEEPEEAVLKKQRDIGLQNDAETGDDHASSPSSIRPGSVSAGGKPVITFTTGTNMSSSLSSGTYRPPSSNTCSGGGGSTDYSIRKA
jgi:potassium channel subfamily K